MKKIISVIMALSLVACMSAVAFAKESPTATEATTTTTTTKATLSSEKKTYNGGTVSIKTDPNTNEVTYTVNAKDGYKFTGWNIEGDYTIVSGSLESGTITVIFNSGSSKDVKPTFAKVSSGDNENNDPSKSPVTSDNGIYVILLGAVALGGVLVSKKRLAK